MKARHRQPKGEASIRGITRALVIASLIVGVVMPSVPARAGPTPYPEDLTFVVQGGGWGHGHGMSQYGARAAAEDGLTYSQILAHYYSNVTIEDRGDPRIRVLLSSGPSVVVGGPETTTARWRDGTVVHTSNSSFPFTRVRATDEGVTVSKGAATDGPWTTVATGTGHVRFFANDAVAVPVWRNGRYEYFRSVVEAYRRSDKTIYLVNELRLNEYLFGVVPREMPALWPQPALRAQAVAARSYTLWKRNSVGSSASYHICATTSCQVYRGYGVRATFNAALEVLEHQRTNDAITATRGVTMVYPGEGPIFAEYNSSSGGYTAQGSRAYLAPVPDSYDARYSPYYRWTDGIGVTEIQRRWPALGRLVRIAIPARDGHGAFGGRVETLRLIGTDSTVTVSGETFRSAMGLRSTLFKIEIYDAEQASAAAEVALAPGTMAGAEVLVRNTGTAAWPVGDAVQLGTHPKNRASAFAAPSWLEPTRPAGIAADASDGNNSVAPGQVAKIRFTLSAPPDFESGTYTERFRMVVPGATWFGSVILLPVRVGSDGVSHLGGNLAANPSFEALDGGSVAAWRRTSGPEPALSAAAIDGVRSLRLPSTKKAWTRVRQTIERAGRAGQRYVLSGWHRAAASGAGKTFVRAVVKHADGSSTRKTIWFGEGSHGWTYREAALVTQKRFGSIELILANSGQRGSVWFDRVGLMRQEAVNAGFEAGGPVPSGWTLVHSGANDGAATGRVRQGERALRLSGRDGVVYARQDLPGVEGDAGDHLRLGGWTRASGVTSAGGAIQLRARLHLTDGSSATQSVDLPRDEHGWLYGEATIVAPKAFDAVSLFAWVADQSGAVWFDDIVFAPVGARPTMAANGGFEIGSPAPEMWKLSHAGPGRVTSSTAGAKGNASLHLRGAAQRDRYVRQPIPVGGAAGERFVLSGWNKTSGSDARGGPVQIWVLVVHADGSTASYRLGFTRRSHDWIFHERTFTTRKAFVELRVFARFAKQSGDAWFDAIRVTREI